MVRNFVCSLCFFMAIVFYSCTPGLHYSAEAYQRDSTIEMKAIQIVKKTSESYTTHAAEVDALKTDIDNALAEEKKRKGNKVTVSMWQAVQQDKGNLYDLFQLWQANGTVSPSISEDINKKIERLLGTITELENHKKK